MTPSLVIHALIFVFIAGRAYAAGDGHTWSYYDDEGPKDWPHLFPKSCDGDAQSPIDIIPYYAKNIRTINFFFTGYDTVLQNLSIVNNGHSISASVPKPSNEISISGGGLIGVYRFASFHLHWGKTPNDGSEHTIDGQVFPLELHMVHVNAKYPEAEAANNKDGIAVLGILFDNRFPNWNLDPITKVLPKLRNAKSASTIPRLQLSQLLPEDTSRFYRYEGSLTTPNCNEVVTWTVFKTISYIGRSQMDDFRKLLDAKGRDMSGNFRFTQPLKGRKVYVRG